jgi:hypothetical protein
MHAIGEAQGMMEGRMVKAAQIATKPDESGRH